MAVALVAPVNRGTITRVIITLTGENSFAVTQAERQIIDAFVKKHGKNGVERAEGDEITASRLLDLLQGATLFAPVRLVIIKNISANKQIQEPLAEALKHASDTTTVVISDSNLDKRTKLYKFFKTKTEFKDFPLLDSSKLATWAQQTAKDLGGDLDKTNANFLVQRVGGNQWRLQQEIGKLVSYSSEITKESITQLVEASAEGTAFELLDAVLAGKMNEVTRMVTALKTEEDPYKLFGLLSSQVYALAVISAASSGASDQIAKDAGLHPFVVRKTQAAARKLGPDKVKQIVQEVADCDWRLKSTGGDPWQLLANTLHKICV